jgi:N-acetylglucosamine malate deacetylase 1
MKILVVSAHPDDETLGCGGSLLKHQEKGDEIFWLNFTDIRVADGWNENMVKKRKQEINKVCKKYNFSKFYNLKYPAIKLDTQAISNIIKDISKVYKDINPELIYIPFLYDIHSDHQIVSKAMQSTFKWFRYPHINKVLMYETPSETEFNFIKQNTFSPNVFINIDGYLEKKINIMKIYESEMSDFPFPRSETTIKSLARFRGSQSGFGAAEAFELVYERV